MILKWNYKEKPAKLDTKDWNNETGNVWNEIHHKSSNF